MRTSTILSVLLQAVPILTFVIWGYYRVIARALATSESFGSSGHRSTPLLFPGQWLPFLSESRLMDLSDLQWRKFRWNMPLLGFALLAFVAIGRWIRVWSYKYFNLPSTLFSSVLVWWYNLFALGFLLYVHRTSAIVVYCVALANYFIAKTYGRTTAGPWLVWAYNVAVLFAVSVGSWSFSSVHPFLGALDGSGSILRWHVYFKITFLRQVSFSMDYIWSTRNGIPQTGYSGNNDFVKRQTTSLLSIHYNVFNYLAFLFYPPLYIAGPISSFNAFVSYTYKPQTQYSSWDIALYGLRLLITIVGLEYTLHFFYYYSISIHGIWKELPPIDVALSGYFVLNFMYVKFYIIWRFFRFFALVEGQNVPENMPRCVNNNYTFTGFWRSWHSSFNTWTIRYLYLPLGGRKTQLINIWLIFLFIGLWHDWWWQWVAWAMLNCVFFSLEILVLQTVHKYFASMKQLPWWKYAVAAAGSTNIFLLMLANLAILHGFQDTPLFLLLAFWEPGGSTVLCFTWIWFFCGVVMMQVIRSAEGNRKRY